MSLNAPAADALAIAICSALGTSDAVAIANWKKICETLYSHLVTDAVVTISSVSGVTTGPGISGPGTGSLS